MFSDARVWRYIISSTSKFIDSVLLKADNKGLTLKGIDPSKTALIEFKAPKESFEKFDISGESTIQVNLDDVSKIMRSAEREDKLTLKWNEVSLTFVFERKGVPRFFIIPLQNIEAQEIPELSLELNNSFKVQGEVLYEAITGIEKVGDVLWIRGKEGELHLSSESDLGEAEVILSSDKGVLEESTVTTPNLSVSYGIEYFSYVKQTARIAETVVIKVDNDMPAQLQFSFIQGAQLNYYVAPRAE